MTKKNKDGQVFDYIIVGSGPAGAVLAKKLSNNKQTSVLVLEAGDNNSTDKPIRDSRFAPPFILRDNYLAQYYWQGKGRPQEYAGKNTYQWTGGRLLGGTTSVNNEQYVRPSKINMQQWEDLLGPLWSTEQETRQFKKLEKYNGITTNEGIRGYNGRLDIRQTPANPTKMVEKFVSAMEAATGLNRIIDYNDPATPVGPFTRWQLYQNAQGVRVSSDTAFLNNEVMTFNGRGVNGRKLTVSFRSTVLQILFDDKLTARGVQYLKDGKCKKAFAKRKVIISAGINSSKILMNSGIGPEVELKKAGVKVLINNPNVGKNLTTHAVTPVSFTANPKDKALPSDDPFALYPGGAFLPDPRPGSNPKQRAVQIIGMPGDKGGLDIFFYLTNPKSKGSLTIQNDDPLKMVLVDEGFLSNPEDLDLIKNIYKIYIRNIAKELNKIDQSYKLISPSLEIIKDDKKLEDFIRNNVSSTHHVQGTNRMAQSAKEGVVDSVGQVFGVKNLIVADDSIAPFVSDGNTSAPAYFIGANIAQQLLEWERLNNEKFGRGGW